MSDLLKIPEAAVELHVSERTLWKLIKFGRLKTYQPSPRRRYVTRVEVAKFKERNTR